METQCRQVAESVAPKLGPKNGPKLMTVVYIHTIRGARFPGCFFGPAFSLFSFDARWNLVSLQAFAMWRWHKFILSEGVGDQTAVWTSMDESCFSLSPQLKPGLVELPSGLKGRLFPHVYSVWPELIVSYCFLHSKAACCCKLLIIWWTANLSLVIPSAQGSLRP